RKLQRSLFTLQKSPFNKIILLTEYGTENIAFTALLSSRDSDPLFEQSKNKSGLQYFKARHNGQFQEQSCRKAMKTPVSVLRLPRGPEPNSRGFDPNSPRYIALCPTTIPASKGNEADSGNLEEEQELRSELRERFLRSLIAMTDKRVQFNLYEKVQVEAKFGASDIDILNFQVSDLQTPLGVQKEALL
ncbi:hypothetical protein NFI96_009899, partial [Prochilodus magdalenae]